MLKSESSFLDFLKVADEGMVVREETPSTFSSSDEPVQFSNVAQDSTIDGKSRMAGRLLNNTAGSSATARAIVSAVLDTKDYESSSLQLKPTEKVSFPRSQTLLERVTSKLGRA